MKQHKSSALRFLLVGCGTIGERHAQLAAAKGKLLATCDILPQRAKRFSKLFDCFGYTSLNDMLNNHRDAEVLVVCTPNGLHAAHSIAGLQQGMHVLCEKPMALHVADARAMNSAAAKAQKSLVIVKQNRYNPPVAAVKELLERNKLGNVYSIQVNCFWNRSKNYYTRSSWRGSEEMDGGVLFTQFSHFIDLLWWFFGDIEKVKGFTANKGHQNITEIEDTGVFTFLTKSKIPGTLHYTTNAKNKNYEGSITIIAEKGTVKIGGAYLNTIEYQEPALIKPEKLVSSNAANIYKGYSGSMNNHVLVYHELLNLIKGKKHHTTAGEEALHSVAMIEQFYKAAGFQRK